MLFAGYRSVAVAPIRLSPKRHEKLFSTSSPPDKEIVIALLSLYRQCMMDPSSYFQQPIVRMQSFAMILLILKKQILNVVSINLNGSKLKDQMERQQYIFGVRKLLTYSSILRAMILKLDRTSAANRTVQYFAKYSTSTWNRMPSQNKKG